MAPTVHELQDLFWRCFWTAMTTFLGALTAHGTFIDDADGDPLTAIGRSAGIAAFSSVLGVVLVYSRQKMPGTGINANPPAGAPQRGENK